MPSPFHSLRSASQWLVEHASRAFRAAKRSDINRSDNHLESDATRPILSDLSYDVTTKKSVSSSSKKRRKRVSRVAKTSSAPLKSVELTKPVERELRPALPQTDQHDKATSDVRRAIYILLTTGSRPDKVQTGPPGVALGTICNTRTENQDRAIIARYNSADDPKGAFALMAVCDGVGGLREGGRCADIALTTVLTELILNKSGAPEERIERSINVANQALFRRYRESGATTFAAIFCMNGAVFAVNVGDTRITQLSRSNNTPLLRILSVEDRLGQRIRDAGIDINDIDPAFANRLSQFIGMASPPKIHIKKCDDIDADAVLLITSDGAHSNVELQTLQSLGQNVEEMARSVLAHAISAGEEDNSTVICSFGSPLALLDKPLARLHFDHIELWTPWNNSALLLPPSELMSDGKREIFSPKSESALQPAKLQSDNADLVQKRVAPEVADNINVELPTQVGKKESLIIEQMTFPDESPS